jgi:hypothetical protein
LRFRAQRLVSQPRTEQYLKPHDVRRKLERVGCSTKRDPNRLALPKRDLSRTA